jgi:ribosome-binding protein aMBF1 (putative translation factor)
MEAGFHVDEVDLAQEKVVFRKPLLRYEVREEGGIIVWDGLMVRALRAHLGMSQEEFADLMGVRQQTVSEWETKVYRPTRSRSKHLTMVAERAEFDFGGVQEVQEKEN